MKTLLTLVIVVSACSVSNADSVNFDEEKLSSDDSQWERVQTSSRAFTTPSITPKKFSNPAFEGDRGEAPSQNSLRDFLETYAEKLRKDKLGNLIDKGEADSDNKDQKSWNLLELQKPRYPTYPTDDRKGWVSLDPVPWSVSKVSKWKPKTTEAPWDSYHHSNQEPNQWENDFVEHTRPASQYPYKKKPEVRPDPYKVYYINDKNTIVNKPVSRPFTVYDQNVQTNYHRNPVKINDFYRPQNSFNSHQDGIITDNAPSNFPVDDTFNRRSGQEQKPEPHPFLGDGEWVLLSTTRGYKAPRHGQRSLDFRPQSIRTQKSVHLTVLPPLKDSKINMTTSHGGLLQVESTFESVEQAHKKYQKQQKDKTKKRKRLNGLLKRKKKVVKNATDSTVTAAPRSSDSSAVLAAMGGGIIPATMAMLVPVMNGRKRRRKREVFTTIDPNTNIEITLPRYF